MITIEQMKNKISYVLQNRKKVWESAPEIASLKQSELERIKVSEEHLDEVTFLVFLHEIRNAINLGKNLKLNDTHILDLGLTTDDNLYKLVTQFDTRPEFNQTELGDTIVQQTLKELGYSIQIPTSKELREIQKAEIIAKENLSQNYSDENLRLQVLEAEKNSKLAQATAGFAPFESGLPYESYIPSVIISNYTKEVQNMSQILEQSNMTR